MKVISLLWSHACRWCLDLASRQIHPTHPDVPYIVSRRLHHQDKIKRLYR